MMGASRLRTCPRSRAPPIRRQPIWPWRSIRAFTWFLCGRWPCCSRPEGAERLRLDGSAGVRDDPPVGPLMRLGDGDDVEALTHVLAAAGWLKLRYPADGGCHLLLIVHQEAGLGVPDDLARGALRERYDGGAACHG